MKTQIKSLVLAAFFAAVTSHADAQNTLYGTGTSAFSNLNTMVGYNIGGSGSANIGDGNSAFGHKSAWSLKDAERNCFFGIETGYNTYVGDDNCYFGSFSGYNNTSGSFNTYLGSYSGYLNSDKNYNVFIGGNSGYYNNVSGSTFVGYNSGYYNTIGVNNVFLGNHAGFLNATGGGNVFVGALAGYSSTASYNVMIGQQAGGATTSGYGNTFVGHGSGLTNITGSTNTYFGVETGANATGNGNVFLGYTAGKAETGSNKLHITNNYMSSGAVIPPLLYGDFSTRKIGVGLPAVFPANADSFPVVAGVNSVTGYQLFVKGGILTEAVLVSPFSGWADYVFAKDYKLKPLSEVEAYINENGHLPNVPSAQDIEKNGIELKNTAILQQEKIEELTLYVIQQNKEIQELKAQMQLLLNKK